MSNTTKFELLDAQWIKVTEVEIPDDPFPNIVIWDNRIFYYDYPNGVFLETEITKVKESE